MTASSVSSSRSSRVSIGLSGGGGDSAGRVLVRDRSRSQALGGAVCARFLCDRRGKLRSTLGGSSCNPERRPRLP
eukprot:scaffold60595_cov36-Phaeocystis_antarctica.AAC.1